MVSSSIALALALALALTLVAFSEAATATTTTVLGSSVAFPAYKDFGGRSYNVTYDKRALMLDGNHVLFLSGAIHPPRGTPDDWDTWLEGATANGLNMVQVSRRLLIFFFFFVFSLKL